MSDEIMKKDFYKIRNKRTGLFSKGGDSANCGGVFWSSNGKTWGTLGHLMSHLTQYVEFNYAGMELRFNIPDDWEIVHFVSVIKKENVVNARSFYAHSDSYKKRVKRYLSRHPKMKIIGVMEVKDG
jgi:hypothetical protein